MRIRRRYMATASQKEARDVTRYQVLGLASPVLATIASLPGDGQVEDEAPFFLGHVGDVTPAAGFAQGDGQVAQEIALVTDLHGGFGLDPDHPFNPTGERGEETKEGEAAKAAVRHEDGDDILGQPGQEILEEVLFVQIAAVFCAPLPGWYRTSEDDMGASTPGHRGNQGIIFSHMSPIQEDREGKAWGPAADHCLDNVREDLIRSYFLVAEKTPETAQFVFVLMFAWEGPADLREDHAVRDENPGYQEHQVIQARLTPMRLKHRLDESLYLTAQYHQHPPATVVDC